MIPSPNQPILFQPSGEESVTDCNSNRWQYKMFTDDLIQWQFIVEPCPDAEQLIENPLFETATDWDGVGANVFPLPSALALIYVGGYIVQDDVTTSADQWYLIEVNISEVLNTLGKGVVTISGFDDDVSFPAMAGLHKFYVKATASTTDVKIALSATSGTGTVIVNEVFLREVTYPEYEFLDTEGNTIADTSNTYHNKDYINYSLVPGDPLLEAGAFYIRVYLTCDETEVSYTSELICIVAENEKDLLIGGCGNVNSYKGDFAPIIRIKGELIRGTGNTFPNRYTYQNSRGLFTNGYTRRNKQYTLKIDLSPEHVRDFIYMTALFNTIGIRVGTEGQENFFLEEEPDEPVFPDGEIGLATITLLLVRKDANEVSVFNGECSPSLPPLVIGERGINQAIQTSEDSEEIELIKA